MNKKMRRRITALLLCIAMSVLSSMPVFAAENSVLCHTCVEGEIFNEAESQEDVDVVAGRGELCYVCYIGSLEYSYSVHLGLYVVKYLEDCNHYPDRIHAILQNKYQRIYICTVCGYKLEADKYFSGEQTEVCMAK